MVRILSFNVNGLRSLFEFHNSSQGQQWEDWLDRLEADIYCFQETKINDIHKITESLANPRRYYAYYSFHQRAYLQEASKGTIGYAGVVTLVKKSSFSWLHPIAFEEGFTQTFAQFYPTTCGVGPCTSFTDRELYPVKLLQHLDAEGRVIMTDHHAFVLINVYCPNDSGTEIRRKYRTQFFPALWKRYVELIHAGRIVILVGDINIAYHPREHCDYATLYRRFCDDGTREHVDQEIHQYVEDAWKHDEECGVDLLSSLKLEDETRQGVEDGTKSLKDFIRNFFADSPMRLWLFKLLHCTLGKTVYFRDSFRHFHPHDLQQYSCWDMQSNARATNFGSRIDMIFTAGKDCVYEGDSDAQHGKILIKNSTIMQQIYGSDHCPTQLEFELIGEQHFPHKAVMLPKNTKTFLNQPRIMSFISNKSTPAPTPVSNPLSRAATTTASTTVTKVIQDVANQEKQAIVELPKTVSLPSSQSSNDGNASFSFTKKPASSSVTTTAAASGSGIRSFFASSTSSNASTATDSNLQEQGNSNKVKKRSLTDFFQK